MNPCTVSWTSTAAKRLSFACRKKLTKTFGPIGWHMPSTHSAARVWNDSASTRRKRSRSLKTKMTAFPQKMFSSVGTPKRSARRSYILSRSRTHRAASVRGMSE